MVSYPHRADDSSAIQHDSEWEREIRVGAVGGIKNHSSVLKMLNKRRYNAAEGTLGAPPRGSHAADDVGPRNGIFDLASVDCQVFPHCFLDESSSLLPE